MFDFSVFIGRFSPFHAGHLSVVTNSLKYSNKVILVCSSANEAPNTRNPFTDKERETIIRLSLPDHIKNNVIIEFSENYLYNDTKWIAGVQNAVGKHTDSNSTITLTGMNKDETSYYLNIFPQWKHSIANEPYTNQSGLVLSATQIRKKIFTGEIGYVQEISNEAKNYITDITDSSEWDRIKTDFKHENSYSSIWGKGPFVTTDAIVIQAGHILLIQRGAEYGQGLFANPGGFLNINETIENGMIRELKEETIIKVPEKVLRGSITQIKVYDNPHRDNRARIITHAFKIELNNVSEGLPKVKGSDDAQHAAWYPIADVMKQKNKFFLDHWHIIDDLIN